MAGGLFSRLFGGGPGRAKPAASTRNEAKAVDYNGYRIVPAPIRQDTGWLTAGYICREIAGEMKEHHFVRADTLASQEAAEDHTILKARRAIDEQGEALFKDG